MATLKMALLYHYTVYST